MNCSIYISFKVENNGPENPEVINNFPHNNGSNYYGPSNRKRLPYNNAPQSRGKNLLIQLGMGIFMISGWILGFIGYNRNEQLKLKKRMEKHRQEQREKSEREIKFQKANDNTNSLSHLKPPSSLSKNQLPIAPSSLSKNQLPIAPPSLQKPNSISSSSKNQLPIAPPSLPPLPLKTKKPLTNGLGVEYNNFIEKINQECKIEEIKNPLKSIASSFYEIMNNLYCNICVGSLSNDAKEIFQYKDIIDFNDDDTLKIIDSLKFIDKNNNIITLNEDTIRNIIQNKLFSVFKSILNNLLKVVSDQSIIDFSEMNIQKNKLSVIKKFENLDNILQLFSSVEIKSLLDFKSNTVNNDEKFCEFFNNFKNVMAFIRFPLLLLSDLNEFNDAYVDNFFECCLNAELYFRKFNQGDSNLFFYNNITKINPSYITKMHPSFLKNLEDINFENVKNHKKYYKNLMTRSLNFYTYTIIPLLQNFFEEKDFTEDKIDQLKEKHYLNDTKLRILYDNLFDKNTILYFQP